MKVKIIIFIISIHFTYLLNGCKSKNYCTIIENEYKITLSSLLQEHNNIGNISYCELIYFSVQKNKNSIIDLIRYPVEDAISYDHGYIITQILLIIGEDIILEIYKSGKLTIEDLELLKSLIEVGIEYGDFVLEDSTPKKLFPKIYKIGGASN